MEQAARAHVVLEGKQKAADQYLAENQDTTNASPCGEYVVNCEYIQNIQDGHLDKYTQDIQGGHLDEVRALSLFIGPTPTEGVFKATFYLAM